MERTARLFEVIQILRAAKKPVRACEIAEKLEVSQRTVYRDIAALQAMRTPILGEAGVGYVMRGGYDLPPINFDAEEAEALLVALNLVVRTGDQGLLEGARRAARKLSAAVPYSPALLASDWGAAAPLGIDMTLIRDAIRSERKLRIAYENAKAEQSRRIVWPLALIYYIDNAMLVAWCELRDDFRHFRIDRMAACEAVAESFFGEGARLRQLWEATLKQEALNPPRGKVWEN